MPRKFATVPRLVIPQGSGPLSRKRELARLLRSDVRGLCLEPRIQPTSSSRDAEVQWRLGAGI